MQLRYFFDPGSCVCLWASDDEARNAFDYAVALEDLPLSAATRALGNALVAEYDTCLDGNDPGAGSLWTPGQETAFIERARHFLAMARAELGPRFELVDELEP